VIYVHIDKKKKFPATALLRAFGYGTNADILELFYATKDIDITASSKAGRRSAKYWGRCSRSTCPTPRTRRASRWGRSATS